MNDPLSIESCPECNDGQAGNEGMGPGVETPGSIETGMSCGCGGYVTQSIRRCARCGSFYLAAFEDHQAPSTADSFMFEIDRVEAEALIGLLKKCPDIENRNCACPVHRQAETWHKGTKGIRRYFKAIPQDED